MVEAAQLLQVAYVSRASITVTAGRRYTHRMTQVHLSPDELFEAAMRLTADERSQLATRILEITWDEVEREEGYEEAWEAEIRRRLDDINSGRVNAVPWETVKREMAERLDAWRR